MYILLVSGEHNFHADVYRSKTQLTEKVLACAKKLLVIGCFCIGTNQVNLEYAASRGVCP